MGTAVGVDDMAKRKPMYNISDDALLAQVRSNQTLGSYHDPSWESKQDMYKPNELLRACPSPVLDFDEAQQIWRSNKTYDTTMRRYNYPRQLQDDVYARVEGETWLRGHVTEILPSGRVMVELDEEFLGKDGAAKRRVELNDTSGNLQCWSFKDAWEDEEEPGRFHIQLYKPKKRRGQPLTMQKKKQKVAPALPHMPQ